MFLNIDDLVEGDSIFINVLGEELEYQVYSKEIIHPSEYGKLAVVPGKDTLTLLSCTFELVNPDRILVNAVRVNEPVETVVVQPEEQTLTEVTAEPVERPEHSLKQTIAPQVKVKRYGLMGVTGLIWVVFLLMIIRLIRSYRTRPSDH